MSKKMVPLVDWEDDRPVHGYMNFKRKVTPDPFKAYGPTVGEYPMDVYAVQVSEDGKRVGYTLIAPGDG